MKYREQIPSSYSMKLSFLLRMLFGGILSCSHTYAIENLAQIQDIKGTPAQSTSYHNVFAVDGEFEDAGEQTACSYTVGGNTIFTAWWKFPLKKLCYVEYLLIYFRSSTVNRHVGFSVYVFNDSSFVPPSSGSGYTVFTQNTTTCVERVMNITVSTLTKGIALYISKKPPVTTSCPGYSTFATIEVCEVQVFGCLNENYGDVCQPCPSKCFNNLCDGLNGSCIYGCSNPRKEAPDCSKCVSGYYGGECNQRCGHCTEEIFCNISSGECSEGCKENWAGLHCDKCVEGYYGSTCSSECGYCKNGTFCNSSTGTCEEGCQKHWSRPNCNVCKDGYYGVNCTLSCGKCKDGTFCNSSSGDCPSGCQENWQGSKCDSCEDGFYGTYCIQECGSCKNGTVCNNITGICEGGCLEHWNGTKCDECQNGYYGKSCAFVCGNCRTGTSCNSTGDCPAGCQRKWQGSKCDKCGEGFYSANCSLPCGRCQNGSFCDNITGDCSTGCRENWQGSKCDVCSNGLYGVHCNFTCGHCLNGTVCDPISGVCNEGCLAHWSGLSCDACRNGFYGTDCSIPCGKCQTGTFCDDITGGCPSGCQEDWQGWKCDVQDSGASNIVGSTLGTLAVVFSFGVIFGFFYIRRRKSKNMGSSSVSFSRIDHRKADDKNINLGYANISATTKHRLVQEPPNEENSYYNATDTSTDIKVNHLLSIIEKKSEGEPNVFFTEYKRLPAGDENQCQVAQLSENRNKNRFKTTFPYDDSRVVLEEKWKDTDNDYINANFIKDFKDKKRYIAAQGATSTTLLDFWRLIWQENVKCIVMLTNLFENGKNKCVKYWPDQNERMKMGMCRISLLEEIKYAFYTVRRLSIQRTDSSLTRDIIHLHYTCWPDHGTPEEIGLVQFHKAVTKRYKPGAPLLVHCSAGVGRTGTFIGYDSLLRQGKETGRINVFEFVRKMREDRMSMVQTQKQYTFLHKALVCGFFGEGKTINQADVEIEINKLLNDDSPQNQQTLYNEYKLLSSLKQECRKNSKGEVNGATRASNCHKAADDNYLVYLTSYVKGRSNYIYAVIVPSYTDLEGFIITHKPLPDTEIDLWRLCMDYSVDVIVVLDGTEDNWWLPKRGTSKLCSPYKISNQETGSDVRGVTQEELELSVKGKRRHILLYKIATENQKHVLQSVRFLLEKDMQNDGKTLIISKDGAGATGLFIALHNVLQQLRIDGDIDLFTTVRLIQLRKPDAFNQLEDYRSCYQLILESRSEEVYANV